MNTSTKRKPKLGTIGAAMAVALAMGATPAFGDDHDYRGDDTGYGNHKAVPVRHAHPVKRHAPPRYAHDYAPPQVYYAPRPSPGISLFIPL